MPPTAVIIGAPGAGKTSVGRRVAERLGVPFADSDHLVEQSAGARVADIFVDQGEPHFRQLEQEAIADAVRDFDGVLSIGGGAVMTPGTPDLLAGIPVVWLEVDLGDAVSRVGMNASRPLLLGNVRGTLAALLRERAPVYEALATVRIQTSGKPLRAVVDDVCRALSDRDAA
ncbi:MAG: shikimate kinase [Actinobacteria bacterium]|nr:shikimate kinase [Actinomycetota bacterium]